MSRNDWERGEIKMSVKEFGAVRRDLITFHNQRSADLFVRAQQVYQTLKISGKGKRGFNYHDAFEAVLNSNHSTRYSVSEVDGYHEIFDSIFPNEKIEKLVAGQIIPSWERSAKPKAPKRNQFAPLKMNSDRIPVGHEAGIGFDKAKRVIIWSVSENNHAVERAHEHSTGREFFKRLSRVVWTRGTGGEIVGNDEYNQDNRESGGGANYTTHRFGVAEKQFKQSFAAARSWR